MKKTILVITILFLGITGLKGEEKVQYKKLTPEETRVIVNKGTEAPFSGKYEKFSEKGTYVCKRCGAPLYRSEDKFDAKCGWPSFDEAIKGAVKRIPDPDGIRTEIVCANCGAHLGHVFTGEKFTPRDVRYCVNSISMDFIPAGEPLPPVIGRKEDLKPQKVAFAGGCFWGVEALLKEKKGVLTATAGYTGGHKAYPTYKEVCYEHTGHAEAVEVTYDPNVVSFEDLCKYFFEIHDPTQMNRQGPDVGDQYRSEIFYTTKEQEETAKRLIEVLKRKGYNVVTKVEKLRQFWVAEAYHQDYYEKTGKVPYCHRYTKRF